MRSTAKRYWQLSDGRSTSSSEIGAAVPAPSTSPSALQRWLPVIIWAGFISWFSTDAFSARSTNNYIDPLLRYFFGELTPAGFRLAHTIIRKSAHLTEYGILGALMCRALTAPGARIARATILRAVAYCAAYATLDEAHQLFVPSRTGSPVDVLIDTTGATIGSLLLTLSRRRPPS